MKYDYTDSGFDGFLSRSVDDLSQLNLESNGPQTTQRAFDRGQVSGQMGDILMIGKIRLDGVKGRVSTYDDNGNEVTRLGELDE